MKKKPYILILLILSSIFISFKYMETQRAKQDLQNSIDNTFRYQLNNILSSLSMEVNEYSYRMILSSVSNAASISELTSYEDVNDNLDISLHNLYISLREEKSKEKVLSRTGELREIFLILIQEPTNKVAMDQLIQITNETFFNVKE